LRDRKITLFSFKATLFFYDLTNTYFEGNCLKNTLAKRGKSKQKRSDCPLVTQSEPKTLKEILNELYSQKEELFKEHIPTIVMDRGIATKENIELLRSQHYPYIAIERRPAEKDFPDEFQSVRDTFEKISPDNKQAVYIKKILFDEGCRVLCCSEGREYKERAISTLQENRFLEALTSLQKSVAKRNILLPEKVALRIGRLKERYPTVSRLYDITMDVAELNKMI